MSRVKFTDAQQMAIKNPDTFSVPGSCELSLLKAGDYVKVCYNAERFWVLLTVVDGDKLSGSVDNDLIFEQPFKLGDSIAFEKRNVYDIITVAERKTIQEEK